MYGHFLIPWLKFSVIILIRVGDFINILLVLQSIHKQHDRYYF